MHLFVGFHVAVACNTNASVFFCEIKIGYLLSKVAAVYLLYCTPDQETRGH